MMFILFPLGDNLIDLVEYTTFFAEFGIKSDECKEAFDKISGVSSTGLIL